MSGGPSWSRKARPRSWGCNHIPSLPARAAQDDRRWRLAANDNLVEITVLRQAVQTFTGFLPTAEQIQIEVLTSICSINTQTGEATEPLVAQRQLQY